MKTLNASALRPVEKIIMDKLSVFVPPFIGTKMLSCFGLLSSLGIFISYYLCKRSYVFLFFASFFIMSEWVFDCLDGAIGRARKEGFVRWGYYMDHLFDYFFLSSIVIGLYFIFPQVALQLLFLFLILSAFMGTFFLIHGAAKNPEFKISFWGISPIEFRLFIIGFNTVLFFNPAFIRAFVLKYSIFLNLTLLSALIIVIYFHQKQLDAIDRSHFPTKKENPVA